MKLRALKRGNHAGRSRCEHGEQRRTVNYGLERCVCLLCGEVTVRDLGHTGSGELFQGLAPIHQR